MIPNLSSQVQHHAFAMKFKMPGEHRFGSTTYGAEIHIHCASNTEINKKALKEFFSWGTSPYYKQFAQGYNKVDALGMEKIINEMTDFILVIPLKVDTGNDTPNLFLHYINHEDWFEASALGDEESQLDTGDKLKINNKDLEDVAIQDSKNKGSSIKDTERNDKHNKW